MFRKSAGLGAATRAWMVVIELPFQNAGDFVEERFHRTLVGILQAPPQQAPFGIAQRRVNAVLQRRFLRVAAQVEAVRAFKTFVLNAPDDAFFGNNFLQHGVKAVVPLLRLPRSERTW